MKILNNFTNNEVIIKKCCSLISILLTDDDLRVPFGKASDRAQEFVKEGMLTKLLFLVKGKKYFAEFVYFFKIILYVIIFSSCYFFLC